MVNAFLIELPVVYVDGLETLILMTFRPLLLNPRLAGYIAVVHLVHLH